MPRVVTIPTEVAEHTQQLGYRVRLARTRRGISIADLAKKAAINRKTLIALEAGRASVSLGAYITVLWALGLNRTLEGVAHPDADIHGKALEAARQPARVRKSRAIKDEYDF